MAPASPSFSFPFDGHTPDSGIGSPLYRNALHAQVELLPNPDFVFPLPSPEPSSAGLDMPPPASRRQRSIHSINTANRLSGQGQNKSVNALPEFSFNPSGTTAAVSPSSTPPVSPLPNSPTLTSRNFGHRRGGSEFIGGDGRTGAASLMSASPPKTDGFIPPPSDDNNNTLRPGPPPGRRGHAHRRSGAISCHDLAAILQPKDPNASGRGGSAPSTPRESDMGGWPRHAANKSVSYPSLRMSSTEENQSPEDDPSSPRRPPSRARVGFSDRVEYIRPLSTISSETESSMSTIRGHSVSNSLSSVISAGAPSPPSSRLARPTLNTTFEDEHRTERPLTAGAVLDKVTKGRDGLTIELFGRQRPLTAVNLPSPVSPGPLFSPVMRQIPKKRNFFHLNHRRAQPSADLLTSNSEPSLITLSPDSPPASPMKDATPISSTDTLDVPRSKDKSKRARKVKSWTNPFGSKKPKSPTAPPADLGQRIPTPPPSAVPVEELSLDDLSHNFDVDETVTIVTPTNDAPVPQHEDYVSWKPKHISAAETDSRSPIIDLDLALGPFEPAQRSRGGTGRNFASARRTMHSSSFAAGLFAPSLNHRRTESAPALVPFELRKAASTSAMADVFEEDEEEAADEVMPPKKQEAADSPAPSESIPTPAEEFTPPPQLQAAEPLGQEQPASPESMDDEEAGFGIQVVESDWTDGSPITWNFKDSGLRIRRAEHGRRRNLMIDASASPLSKPTEPVEVVEDYEEPRTSSLTRSSDSTVTPTLEDGPKELQPPMSLPVPLPQQTLMTPDTLTSSSFSSPDFKCRQGSFEAPRLGTASSVADNRTINSMVLGEPGPELRISVDDVPSLTSSRSTMTSALQYGNLPMLSPRNPGDRTSSISSAPSAISDRRRKRSSIASLSRLVTGNFSERSKLYIEQRPQSEHMDLNITKKSKERRTKRLSKLMQFWRSSSYSK